MIEHIELKTLQSKITINSTSGYSLGCGGKYGMDYNDEKTNPQFLQYEKDLKYAYELNRFTPHSEILYRYYNSTLWETHSKEIRAIPNRYHIIPGSPAEEMGNDFKVCWADKYKYKWYYLEEAISNRMKTVNSNKNGIIIEPEYYLDFLREWLRSVIELYGDYKYARLFRWGYWRNINTDEFLCDLNNLIDVTNIVDSYTEKDALEWGIENIDSHPAGHIPNTNYKLWHNLLSRLWRGLECGLEEEVLPILKSWQSFEQRCFDNELEEQLYEFIGFKIQYCRRKVSLGWIEFQCYKQLNNKSEQIRVLDEMINLHPTLLDDLGGRIWHIKSYVSINRIFEAAILKYTLEPNAFNKLVCYNLYTYSMPQLMHEGMECSVERGITVFDYVDRVLKLDYK